VKEIEKKISELIDNLKKTFPQTFKALILYGSWAKGTAREDSDIDVIAIFSTLDSETRKKLFEFTFNTDSNHPLDFVYATVEDFERERMPLYTAVKKECKILFGGCNMELLNIEPHIKYKEFFLRSKEFETNKIKMAEEIKKEHPTYGGIELCYIASKHAIQASLAMKGAGYSSKVKVLLPLCEKHFGSQIADSFRKLFQLYIKSEYGLEPPSEAESTFALDLAKEVIKVYETVAEEMGI